MKTIIFRFTLLLCLMTLMSACRNSVESSLPAIEKPSDELRCTGTASLENAKVAVSIDQEGNLVSLSNVATGQNYAGGKLLWRLYYDSPEEKEIEITGCAQQPEIYSDGKTITICYDSLSTRDVRLGIQLVLTVTLDDDKVRFGSTVANGEDHLVIREFHYPLVRNAQFPKDHKLYTCEAGGHLFSDPVAMVSKIQGGPYMKPDQHFRQRRVKYGNKTFMNCYGLFGENQGLYFGSHDDSFQDTFHGMRAYKDANGDFKELEFGFYKFPHCFKGEKWSCDANVIAPYSGTWHVASAIYRKWVDTWWDHRPTPQWVREMKSWQRVIFKHQYGEYFYKYTDMNGKVDEAGQTVGCNALFLFGWWAEGMDHGNPDYSPDESQGGDAALKREIEKYQSRGNHLLLYYNGKLIDKESRYYKSGLGPKVCRHDNTGSEIIERYKFTGFGNWLGEYDCRSFVVANMMDPRWNKVLFELQDRAYELGAHSVFYDQLGFIESSTDWDTSKEYPVPDVYGLKKRAECLKLLRDRYKDKAPDFALGTESTVDVLSQYCDYTHGVPENSSPYRWLNFFRYTFPELILTDRGHRDDTDIKWKLNNTVLDGMRNDIEVYRCRGIISDTPVYQAYLKQVNDIKERYKECLMLGRYNDVFGFTCSNDKLDARSFVSEDGNRMAVVVAYQSRKKYDSLSAEITAPGYRLTDSMATGGGQVGVDGNVRLGQYDLAVLLFEKE